MNSNETMQRFYQVPGKVAYETDEVVLDHSGARIVFRETEKRVRDKRVSNAQGVMVAGLGQFVLFSILTFVPILYFLCLFIPFTAIGFWGVRWVAKQRVFEEQQKVYFGIDADRQTIVYWPHGDKTEEKIDINQIRSFYSKVEHDDNSVYSYLCCTYGKQEKKVVLRSSGFPKDQDQVSYYARLLGFLCNKDVLEHDALGRLRHVKQDKAFP